MKCFKNWSLGNCLKIVERQSIVKYYCKYSEFLYKRCLKDVTENLYSVPWVKLCDIKRC